MAPVYLNNAATSWPKAANVSTTVAACIDDLPVHAGRSASSSPDAANDCRSLLAALLQVAEPERIVLCSNATHALNIALHGICWRQQAIVLTSAAEHNSVLRPLHYLSKSKKLTVHMIPVDKSGRILTSVWEKALKRYHPQLAVFTHASNVTGAINDVAVLAGMAKKAGALTLLDASQSLGIAPVMPTAWGLDLVAFTGHKYLLGPAGTGGLYIAPGIELEPVFTGGTGIHSNLDEMPPFLPLRFEAGTPNEAAIAGLASALTWARQNPFSPELIQAKLTRLQAGLLAVGAKVITVDSPHTPVLSFTLPGWPTEDVGEALCKSFDIICRTGLHCAPRIHTFLGTSTDGTVRLSLSRFTTDDEIDQCLTAIKAMLHELV